MNPMVPGMYHMAGLFLTATLRDMGLFTWLMKDHATFLSGGLDPSQGALVDQADRFAKGFENLLSCTLSTPPHSPEIANLAMTTLNLTAGLRDFKEGLVCGLRACRVYGILPADLIDHIRREADFYIGMLSRATGGPPTTRQAIGIGDGTAPAYTLPSMVIGMLPPDQRTAAQLEEVLFWGRLHGEHAAVLAMYTRPQAQDDLRQQLLSFQSPFADVVQRAYAAEKGQDNPQSVIASARELTARWHDLLSRIVDDLQNCRVPTGQMNVWPTLVDHIRREACYTLAVLGVPVNA